ncbi:MAG: TolC family protein [Bacteroidales bacterium]
MSVKYLMAVIILSLPLQVPGQDFDNFLRQVAEKNPEIISYGKMLETRRAEARTNFYPPGPEASFGYMPGKSSLSGVKKIWSVSQRFDFPSKYLAMKNISRKTVVLAEKEFELGKLNILLDAQLTLYDYLFRKKLLALLVKRSSNCTDLIEAWKKKLEAGETTILDYNRIALELSGINLKKNKTAAEVSTLEHKLVYMTGGIKSFPEEIEYPQELISDPDSLIGIKLSIHPEFAIPAMEYELSLGEVSLSCSSNLPGLMVGYSSEILPVESYTGPVFGISVPLWANTGKVKSAKARSYQVQAETNAKVERLKTEIRREYSLMASLKQTLSDLQKILKSSSGVQELLKALQEGEITLTEYFSMLEVIYDTEEKLIETENEYCRSVAVLNDHLLLRLAE